MKYSAIKYIVKHSYLFLKSYRDVKCEGNGGYDVTSALLRPRVY